MSDALTVRILGCGSSGGVPRLGLDGAPNWGVCDPTEPKNRRGRCSILARRISAQGETRVLIDTAPDLREQLLAARIGWLDAVLVTHGHADQLHGMDDLRVAVLNVHGKLLDVWSDQRGMADVLGKFGYCFHQPPGSDYPPILNAHEIPEPFAPFAIAGAGGPISIRAFGVGHGRLRALGYRLGPVAYTPDVDALDDAGFAALAGTKTWIVDALRHTPHPSHAHLARTLDWIAQVRPKRAILTNLHIDMDYEELRRTLPAGVEPAWDGMEISVPLD